MSWYGTLLLHASFGKITRLSAQLAQFSTAHSLHRFEDKFQRIRRCPKINSENQRIQRPVFHGQPFKELFIPKAIDDYNHHMKGVDQADHLRANFIHVIASKIIEHEYHYSTSSSILPASTRIYYGNRALQLILQALHRRTTVIEIS
jgi:hypothetical protein